jgi:hypothetical protein
MRKFAFLVGVAALAAVVVGQGAALAETLQRKFKVGESDRYRLSMDMGEAKVEGEITLKTLQVSETGGEVEFFSPGVKMSMMGTDMDEHPAPLKAKMDRNGLLRGFAIDGPEMIFALYTAASYVPAVKSETGQTYEIKWSGENDSRIEGRGKVIEVIEKDGVAVVVCEHEMTIYPENISTPGEVKVKSTLERETGKLISAEGTLQVEAETGKVKVERLPTK